MTLIRTFDNNYSLHKDVPAVNYEVLLVCVFISLPICLCKLTITFTNT